MTDPLLFENAPFLYAITDTGLSGFSHFELVNVLVEHGVRLIQIREKRAGRAFFEEVVRSVAFARDREARIIINDGVDVACASGADGVHLGKDDLPPEVARKIVGRNKTIGYSTHSVSEAVAVAQRDIDYIAIGPIFETRTKISRYDPLGLRGISEVRKHVKKPLVAIGGITLERVAEVIESGADAVAVISDLLCMGEIGKRIDDYLSALCSLKRTM